MCSCLLEQLQHSLLHTQLELLKIERAVTDHSSLAIAGGARFRVRLFGRPSLYCSQRFPAANDAVRVEWRREELGRLDRCGGEPGRTLDPNPSLRLNCRLPSEGAHDTRGSFFLDAPAR